MPVKSRREATLFPSRPPCAVYRAKSIRYMNAGLLLCGTMTKFIALHYRFMKALPITDSWRMIDTQWQFSRYNKIMCHTYRYAINLCPDVKKHIMAISLSHLVFDLMVI